LTQHEEARRPQNGSHAPQGGYDLHVIRHVQDRTRKAGNKIKLAPEAVCQRPVVNLVKRDMYACGGQIRLCLREHCRRQVRPHGLDSKRVEEMQMLTGAAGTVQNGVHVFIAKQAREEARGGRVMPAERPAESVVSGCKPSVEIAVTQPCPALSLAFW
jgi:hypothetical protein